MSLKGDVVIHAPQQRIWELLTDLSQIGPCMGAKKSKAEFYFAVNN